MPDVTDCTRCPALVKQRSRIVNGRGPADASLVVVGQNPGRNEDEQGKPFIGRAGNALASLLEGAGISPPTVRLTNACRCWSPGNRKPNKDELANCREYLIQEIQEVGPAVIVAMGAPAIESLYRRVPITDVLGRELVQEDTGIPMIPTYHPAHVMRRWNAAPLVIEHLKKARKYSPDEAGRARFNQKLAYLGVIQNDR